jgi:hypothetical protein
MAGAAMHKQRNHGASPRRKVRRARLQIVNLRSARHGGWRGEQLLLGQQPRQGHIANPHGVASQELASAKLRGVEEVHAVITPVKRPRGAYRKEACAVYRVFVWKTLR